VKLITPDGAWTVEAINLDGQPCFRVKHLGYVNQGSKYPTSTTEVARLLGPAFADLEVAP
jgi:hypothetical protein